VTRDPQEPHDRVGRFRYDAADEAWWQVLNERLVDAEFPVDASGPDPSALPIIYIVGAPRSGSTLLSQVLSRFLSVGYINNLIARFWLRPSVGIRLSRRVVGEQGRNTISFASEHGTTRGVAEPHEFGYFWRKWLQLDGLATHTLDAAAVAALDAAGFRIALEHEILRPFGAPVVFKNLICGFQANTLTAVHRPSLFIHIRRDLEPSAASILATRQQRHGSYEAWWSLKPSTYSAIARLPSAAEQVVRQIQDTNEQLSRQLTQPDIETVAVTYESLCRNPRAVVEDVAHRVIGLGGQLTAFDGIPNGFTESRGPSLPAELQRELHRAIRDSKG